jgi:hypothetical protein
MLKIKYEYIITELSMSEQSDLYVIKNKNNDNLIGSYILTIKNGKQPRGISQYKYSIKKLKDLLTRDTINNYEIVFFKKVSYGSIYELKQIKKYYIDELKAIN